MFSAKTCTEIGEGSCWRLNDVQHLRECSTFGVIIKAHES